MPKMRPKEPGWMYYRGCPTPVIRVDGHLHYRGLEGDGWKHVDDTQDENWGCEVPTPDEIERLRKIEDEVNAKQRDDFSDFVKAQFMLSNVEKEMRAKVREMLEFLEGVTMEEISRLRKVEEAYLKAVPFLDAHGWVDK